MNYQFHVFKWTFIHRLLKWLIVYFILFYLMLFLLRNYLVAGYGVSIIEINDLLGILNIENFNLLSNLFFLFQVGLTFYYSYIFITFERSNSPEFVFPRINSKKWLFFKLLFLFLFIILFKILIYFSVSFVLDVSFPISILLFNLVTYLIIPIIIFIIMSFKHYKYYFSFVGTLFFIILFILSLSNFWFLLLYFVASICLLWFIFQLQYFLD